MDNAKLLFGKLDNIPKDLEGLFNTYLTDPNEDNLKAILTEAKDNGLFELPSIPPTSAWSLLWSLFGL